MTRARQQSVGVGLGVVALAFVAGILVDSWLRVYGPPLPRGVRNPAADATALREPKIGAAPATPRAGSPARGSARRNPDPSQPASLPASSVASDTVATSGHNRSLRMPIEGIEADSLRGGFAEARTGHPHEAVDMLAPRNTPVRAVDDGRVAKLFVSAAGGNTIYEFDPTGRYAYYYAHLERYESGLREGDQIKRGQVIGYVGTSGNAPPNTPHLHFAVFELGPERQWWKGKAIDPYTLFR